MTSPLDITNPSACGATILPFKPRHPTFHPEMVLFEGRQRRQWAVVERRPDGSESAFAVYGGKKSEAIAMARIYAEVEAREREADSLVAHNPLGRMVMALSPDDRKLLAKILRYVDNRAMEKANNTPCA